MRNGRLAIEWVMAGCVVAGVVGCGDPSAEDSGLGGRNEARRTSALSASAADGCALLDNPGIRRRMSSSLETGLLRACGRAPAAAADQTRVSGRPSNGAPPATAAAATTGIDVR